MLLRTQVRLDAYRDKVEMIDSFLVRKKVRPSLRRGCLDYFKDRFEHDNEAARPSVETEAESAAHGGRPTCHAVLSLQCGAPLEPPTPSPDPRRAAPRLLAGRRIPCSSSLCLWPHQHTCLHHLTQPLPIPYPGRPPRLPPLPQATLSRVR